MKWALQFHFVQELKTVFRLSRRLQFPWGLLPRCRSCHLRKPVMPDDAPGACVPNRCSPLSWHPEKSDRHSPGTDRPVRLESMETEHPANRGQVSRDGI